MESQTEDMTAGQSAITNHKPITNRKSPGPRMVEGKNRSSQNARKHGLYSNDGFFRDAGIALGEDPREFERLLKGLVLARQPADTLEMVLVEDIALLIWKKGRLDRAEAAVQVCNLHKHDLERRKQSTQVGREITDTLESEVRENGLRRSLDAPGKFEQVLSFLQGMVEMVEKNDFSYYMQESLRALYGTDPTLRGAALYDYYFKLSKMKPDDQDFEEVKNLMAARLAEEIADVGREYELFLHEHVENTRAARVAATAPSHAQWAAIIRQQNALHQQLEHKIRLLEEMQEKRKKEQERFAEEYEGSLQRNASGGPRGGRRRVGHTSRSSPCGPKPSGDGSKSAAFPRRESLKAAAGSADLLFRSAALRKCAHTGAVDVDRQVCATRALRRNPSSVARGGGHCPNLTRSAGPASAGPAVADAAEQGRRYPKNQTPGGGQYACNPKKMLNRGNEPKNLLQTKGLTETTPSKRTPFCAGKVAIKAEKRGISVQEASGDPPSPAAHGGLPAHSGKALRRVKVGEGAALPSELPKPTEGLKNSKARDLGCCNPLRKAKPLRKSGGRAAFRCYPSTRRA